MAAILDLHLVQHLAASFPNGDERWRTISAREFAADRDGRFILDWRPAQQLEGVGGVYAILLPAAWFSTPRTLLLHAPHRYEGERIPYEFTVSELTGDGYGVVYAGRTANLRQRWRGHLTRGERKDGGQVTHGLVDCGVETSLESALRAVRENARIIYTVLSGPEQCANRDVLECSLCARFGPAFNIKSER